MILWFYFWNRVLEFIIICDYKYLRIDFNICGFGICICFVGCCCFNIGILYRSVEELVIIEYIIKVNVSSKFLWVVKF